MKKIIFIYTLLYGFLLQSCSSKYADLGDGIFAILETNKGDVVVKLEYEKVPITVANFISLAEGKNPFVAEEFKDKPFYDGLQFHRVIPDFMIQGGDPQGNGSGGPGYKFKDEFHPDLKHNKGGVLSMANAGSGTNGSQFFITHKETPWLDNKHSIFGHVIQGMDIVNQIEQNDQIVKLTIVRNGSKATNFDAVKTFKNYYDEVSKKNNAIKTKKMAFFNSLKTNEIQTNSGLRYAYIKKGSSEKPKPGSEVLIHYAGYLEDGELFDTSYEKVAEEYGMLNLDRKAQNGYQPFPFTYGSKDGLIAGFIEAFEYMNYGDKIVVFIPSKLGYGETGSGPIKPNANLIFEIEFVKN